MGERFCPFRAHVNPINVTPRVPLRLPWAMCSLGLQPALRQ